MKILLISIFFPPERGGGATGAWNRAMVFSKLGYSVFVLSAFPTYPTGKVLDPRYKGKLFFVEVLDAVVVLRLRLLPLRHVGYLRRLLIFVNFVVACVVCFPWVMHVVGLKELRITYARSPVIFSSFIGLVYSKLTRTFFVYEAPDLWPDEFLVFKTSFSPIIQLIGRPLAKFSYRIPNMVVTVSNMAASYITRSYEPRVSVYGIPVGVDLTRFRRFDRYESRTRLVNEKIFPEQLHDKFIVLYSGLISSIYRIEDLLRLADKLRSDKTIAILIIGDGPEKQILERSAKDSRLDNLYILPSQPRDIMPVVISATDLCSILLASQPIYQIILPIRFYEYLACKKPMIAFSQGELAQIINSNGIGLTAEVGNTAELAIAVRKIKESPLLMQTLENNCSVTLQKFSLDKIKSDFEFILRREMR